MKETKEKKNNLPELNELEIPAKIYSKDLKDNKDRIFTLSGIPDLVVKFEDSFGIFTTCRYEAQDRSRYNPYHSQAYFHFACGYYNRNLSWLSDRSASTMDGPYGKGQWFFYYYREYLYGSFYSYS